MFMMLSNLLDYFNEAQADFIELCLFADTRKFLVAVARSWELKVSEWICFHGYASFKRDRDGYQMAT